jgi:hypothetical protein
VAGGDEGNEADMDLGAVRHELRQQDGVVSRQQLLAAGLKPSDLDRLLRRKDLTRMLPGVFLDHTGRATWSQRAWAGVLFYEPAALVRSSALEAVGLKSRSDGVVHIGIDADRRLSQVAGYSLSRLSRFEERIRMNTSPPRQRTEDALLDLAGSCPDDLEAIQLLADGIRARHTSADRLLESLTGRSRQARRRWLDQVLHDLSAGTCSVLEHGYLTRVERAHALPQGQRQFVESGSAAIAVRDVRYLKYDVTVELNGVAPDASGVPDYLFRRRRRSRT